jgi:superfamily I DNA and/or RNA helicase
VDPASFQRDERDVIIASTMVSHDGNGRTAGANKCPGAERRVNVAASRARNRL